MKKLENGKWKCDFCNYESDKEGYTKNHEKLKHGGDHKVDFKVNTLLKCPCCGGQKLRLLRTSVKLEKQYMDAGYTKVCMDCNEVI